MKIKNNIPNKISNTRNIDNTLFENRFKNAFIISVTAIKIHIKALASNI